MTDTPTATEPDSECDQLRPFQFTIGALMILTAAVAGFFALLTQANGVIAGCFALGALGTWIYPKYWRGIFAGVSYINVFSHIMFLGPPKLGVPGEEFWFIASLLLCIASSGYAMLSQNRFDIIVGGSFYLVILLFVLAGVLMSLIM